MTDHPEHDLDPETVQSERQVERRALAPVCPWCGYRIDLAPVVMSRSKGFVIVGCGSCMKALGVVQNEIGYRAS